MPRFAAFATMLVWTLSASAQDPVALHVPDARKVGEGRLRVMFWNIHDTALHAPFGRWASDRAFALELSYLRKISGDKIAERSVREIRDQGFDDEARLAQWGTLMRAIFPDVDNGTTLTGVRLSSGETVFYQGSRQIGRIEDPAFAEHFFNIWLSPDTSRPALRKRLLGEVER